MLELNENDLVPVEVRCLTLEESIDELFKGNVIVLQNYEKTRGKDILVRINDKKFKVTEISHDANTLEYEKPYWQIHNVSLNAISLHNAYKKDEYDNLKKYKFLPGTVVHVGDSEKNKVSIVEQMYQDSIGNAYYSLGDREGLYAEDDLVIYEGLISS